MKKLSLALFISFLSTGSFAASQKELNRLANAINELDTQTLQQFSAKDLSPNRFQNVSSSLERWLEDMPIVKGDSQNAFSAKSIIGDDDDAKIAVALKVDEDNQDSIIELVDKDILQAQVGETIYAYVSKSTLQKIAERDELLNADIQPMFYASSTLENALDRYKKRGEENNSSPTPEKTEPKPNPVRPNGNGLVGEGPVVTQVANFHKQGIKGKGVKVGILDFGFGEYKQLQQRGIVPAPRATQTFNQGQPSSNVGGREVHGTACAEIIHQMAPEADLYLAQVGAGDGGANAGDILKAAQWLINQGVDIINFSGGGSGMALDGTSPLDKMVDESVSQKGILWTISAGNEADDHWAGMLKDKDNNGLVDIAENGSGDFLTFECTQAPCELSFTINIDDWPDSPNRSASIGLSAFLVTADAQGNFVEVTSGHLDRKGKQSSASFDMGAGGLKKGAYALVLKAPQNASNVKAHVFFNRARGASLVTKNKYGSLTTPGTSKQGLSVAAYSVITNSIADYSSRGPTDDGRIKPDISAPSEVKSNAYAKEGGIFDGTSAAAPHVAGFAALIKQKDKVSGVGLKSSVTRYVKAIQPQDPHVIGKGLIYAGASNVGKQHLDDDVPEQNENGNESNNLYNQINNILKR